MIIRALARHAVTAVYVAGLLAGGALEAAAHRLGWRAAEREAAEFVAVWPDAWVIGPDGEPRTRG